MASPEGTKPAPKSPVVEDSPVFTYLSTLSPLKLIDSRPGMQLYGDTNCPTPEPVFTSPHFTRPRELSSLKCLSGPDKLPPGHDDRAVGVLPENTEITPSVEQMMKLVPCILKKCSGEDPPQEQPCSSPSTCVDAFLVDPSENCDDPSGSPDHCSKQAVELACEGRGDFASADEDQSKSHAHDLVQAHQPLTSGVTTKSLTSTGLPDLNSDQSTDLEAPIKEITVPNVEACFSTKVAVVSSSSNLVVEESAGEGSSVIVNLLENESTVKTVDDAVEANERSLDKQLMPLSMDVDVRDNSSIVPASGTQLEWNSVDQDLTYTHSFISKIIDVHRGKENPNNSSCCFHEIQDGMVHHTENIPLGGLNCTPQLQLESLKNIQAPDNHLYISEVMSNTSAENHTPYDQEDGVQPLRVMRKRLQFEAVENYRMSAGYETDSWIFTTDVSNVESPVTSLGMEPTNTSNKESTAMSNNKQLIQSVSGNALCRFPCKVDSSTPNKGSPPTAVPRTFGIGLHLNSIGGSININVNMQLPENDLGVEGEKLVGGDDNVSHDPKNCLASGSLIGHHSVKVSTSSDNFSPCSSNGNCDEKQQENQAINVPNSSCQSALNPKPLSSLKPIDRYVTPCSMKKRTSEDASRTESTQRSPKKKRQMKKAPENEGCKRCNCKRSKCLKLYCDCFAAGVFCSEACACQGCYNKSEHEDTVHETRQQIESRNPLAFAPKVVVRTANFSKDTGETQHKTPASARHKRGCNCKKSLCLKKYCECFQAGVGCSLGCRCEGCRNTFGRKDGGEITEVEHEKYKEMGLERDSSVGNMEGIEVKKGAVNIEYCYSRLTPLTPLFQGTNRNDVAKSQLPAKYYLSPESGASVSPSYESPSSPMDSISSSAFAKETEATSSLVPYNEEFGCHTTVQKDSFSPGWDRFPDICNFSPLTNPSPQASGASSASKARESKTLHAKLFQGSGRISVASLRWRSSPVTPLPQLGKGKFVIEPDSDTGLHKNHEDDTPEILKDTCSPIKTVKATSPNQKRVSPPHKQLNEMRPSSSPALRSGRKFILQSVPSFPPLTPYSNNTKGHGT